MSAFAPAGELAGSRAGKDRPASATEQGGLFDNTPNVSRHRRPFGALQIMRELRAFFLMRHVHEPKKN